MSPREPLFCRRYGSSGALVFLLHGGPAAPGYMAPLGRELADEFRLLEPFQRGSGEVPLDVATHVADLHELVRESGERPALVGSSWGAMLALAYAARHPGAASSVVLVGCGTFDEESRAEFRARLAERTSPEFQRRLDELSASIDDADERLRALGDALIPLYAYEPQTTDLETQACDARAHQETWDDMLRLQAEGVYPAAFAAISEPVLMYHGDDDPHPGPEIYVSLLPWIERLDFRSWSRCGHYPWIERWAREPFFDTLRSWLREHAGGAHG